MISPATIKEFQEVLKLEYGRDVSLDQAGLILADLVAYFDTLARIKYETDAGI